LFREPRRTGSFRIGLRSAELCVLTGLTLYVFGTDVIAAQAPLSVKDLVATMLAHEDDEEAHKGNYIYLSKERSERTGGHLWTERIAEIGAGKIRMVKVMRIPCFGRRMTIGRASIVWPGDS
jgi:hypothetical protein